MTKITPDRPHTLHISSAHRGDSDTISQYKVVTSLNCEENEKLQATLISARIPASSWYLEKPEDRTVTIKVNADSTSAGATSYKATATAGILAGSYTQASLISALITAINAEFTTGLDTNLREAATGGSTEDETDAAAADSPPTISTGDTVISSQPVFSITTSTLRNLVQFTRTDAGGKVVLGSFSITVAGKRLAAALGIEPSVEHHSYHARMDLSKIKETFLGKDYVNGYTVVAATNAVSSSKVTTMHYDDDFYVHCSLGTDSITTSAESKGRANVTDLLGVVPQYGNAFEDSFFEPPNTTPMVSQTANVSDITIRITNSAGELIDFKGVDHTMQIQIATIDRSDNNRKANLHTMSQTNSDYHRMHGPSRFATTLR